jgi:UDP-galactopyranose mutase
MQQPVFVCFSHLRWNFVYQRPQHLLSRCAQEHRVYYVEEPLFESDEPTIRSYESIEGVTVVVPTMPQGLSPEVVNATQRRLLNEYFAAEQLTENCILWYYTPMALNWMDQLPSKAVVYDCMDELSMFKGAPKILTDFEADLFKKASLVFTGGVSLYEHKRTQHESVYPFPSSVDVKHFASARKITDEPADQAAIPHPRLGFYGVIDERLDIELLQSIADARPDFHWVILGPVVKIDPETLPKRTNIHYLGSKKYDELPAYIAGWDVALLLFARNDATKFISPTKTPEYLAAGKPVVSTSIKDVVRPYEQEGLVRIADHCHEFVESCIEALEDDLVKHQKEADAFLKEMSWDKTWSDMKRLIYDAAGLAAPADSSHAVSHMVAQEESKQLDVR